MLLSESIKTCGSGLKVANLNVSQLYDEHQKKVSREVVTSFCYFSWPSEKLNTESKGSCKQNRKSTLQSRTKVWKVVQISQHYYGRVIDGGKMIYITEQIHVEICFY